MERRFNRTAADLGNIVALEHVNSPTSNSDHFLHCRSRPDARFQSRGACSPPRTNSQTARRAALRPSVSTKNSLRPTVRAASISRTNWDVMGVRSTASRIFRVNGGVPTRLGESAFGILLFDGLDRFRYSTGDQYEPGLTHRAERFESLVPGIETLEGGDRSERVGSGHPIVIAGWKIVRPAGFDDETGLPNR
jgi:hypothetical protein